MTTYATVAVERIQAYLSRCRALWGRRGASEELVRLTTLPGNGTDDDLAVARILEEYPGVEVNPEGLDIDGVVSLRSKQGAGEGEVRSAACALAEEIRCKLPGITITTSTVTSDDSYAELSRNRDSADSAWVSETWFPVANEFPAARLCGECHVDPAHGFYPHHDGEQLRLCSDCGSRHGGNDRWRSRALPAHSRDVPGTNQPTRFAAEGRLLRELRSNQPSERSELGFSEHFSELGELGPMEKPQDSTEQQRGRTHEDNHTALIFADGNGMGALFRTLLKEAAAGDGSTEQVRKVSKTIKQATAAALLAATSAILSDTDTICPVVPHINGGDDVLVSVAAPRAWQFLVEFLSELHTSFERLGKEHGLPISMSAGMVICKAEYPFANQVELAEALMRRAKSAVGGKESSFAWLDVTHDGLDVRAHRPWRGTQFEKHRDALEHLRGTMTAHGEYSLIRALSDEQNRGMLLAHLAGRMNDVRQLLDLLAISDPAGITEEQAALVMDLTSLGRWWR